MMTLNSPHPYFWFSSLCIFLLACPPVAAGDDDVDRNRPVRLSWLQCDQIDRAEVLRILHLELQSSGEAQIGTSDSVEINIACKPDSYILTVIDGESPSGLSREMPLTVRNSEGRERVLAIAGAELILSFRERQQGADAEVASGDAPPEKAEASPNAAKKISTSSAPTPGRKAEVSDNGHSAQGLVAKGALVKLAFRVSGSGRLFYRGKSFLFGGETGISVRLPGPFELEWRAGAEGGVARRPIGTASLFVASSALMLGVRGRPAEALRLGVQAGAWGGYGRLIGKPDGRAVGHHLSSGIGGPAARVSLETTTRPGFGLSVESGYAFWGITGLVEDAEDVELKGLWFMVALDVWWRRSQ